MNKVKLHIHNKAYKHKPKNVGRINNIRVKGIYIALFSYVWYSIYS